jgi:hypothetical protein
VTTPIRRSSLLAGAVLIAALMALMLTLGAPPAQSAALKPCVLLPSLQEPAGDKPTYNLGLKQTGTTCTVAKKIMTAFHKCRATKSYRCTKKVLIHWTCTGRKSSSSPVIFYANFTCTWGPRRRITSSYQQNT